MSQAAKDSTLTSESAWPIDPYCPEHGDQPTTYDSCSCEGRARLEAKRRAGRKPQGDAPAVSLPVMSNGKTIADQAWWSATPESRWGAGAGDLANYDDIWARCWAYIEEKGLEPPACWIVWDIAYAAIEAMAAVPQSERTSANRTPPGGVAS